MSGTDGACTVRGRHQKGDGSWWEKDAQGIPLVRVCSDCRDEKLSHYRPEILTGYNQGDVDEPIDPEPSVIPELDDLSSYGDA